MCDRKLFSAVLQNVNKCETRVEKYTTPLLNTEDGVRIGHGTGSHFKDTSSLATLSGYNAHSVREKYRNLPANKNRVTKDCWPAERYEKGITQAQSVCIAGDGTKEDRTMPNGETTNDITVHKFPAFKSIPFGVCAIMQHNVLVQMSCKEEESGRLQESGSASWEECINEEIEPQCTEHGSEGQEPIYGRTLPESGSKFSSIFYFMCDYDLKSLLALTNKTKIRNIIEIRIESEYPKGLGRLLIIELMYSVTKFCQKKSFYLEQAGAILSMFYLTHLFFLCSINTTPEKVYLFFKENLLSHCVDCPPESTRLFNFKESTCVILYFCSLYLRNLPIIRLLTLPNFGFNLNYEKQPDPFEQKGKGKGKKDKDKKGKGKK